jgi:hypothetical protein
MTTSPGTPDALAAAQANASDLAARFTTDNTLTPTERFNLVYDLKAATARVDAIERAQR